MLSIYDSASAKEALNQPLDPNLRKCITAKLEQAKAAGRADLTHILVIQPGDTEAVVIDEIGFSPLGDPADGTRFGEPGFQPYWAWLEDAGGWHEIIVTIGNAGFAYLIYVMRAEGVLPDLLAMCSAHALPSPHECKEQKA